MSRELKVAVVGCGHIADGHVGEVGKLEEGEVVAVCDAEPLMAEQLAVRHGVERWYAEFEAMLERERPDVVHVCTPPASHLALARDAAAAGCHVYVEKPLALDHREALELVEAVEGAGRKITIGHNGHFEPPMVELRELLARGVLGECVHVDSWLGYDLSGAFGQAILRSPDHWVHRLPGKLFQNNVNHLLFPVTEVLEDERPEVRATAWRRASGGADGARRFSDVRDELLDELRVTLRGERVSAHCTFSSHVRPVAQFARYYGTRSIAHVDFAARTVTVDRGATLPSAIGRLAAGFSQARSQAAAALRNARRFAASEFDYFAGLRSLIRAFYRSILDDTAPPIPTRDMLRIAWVMDEIFDQIDLKEGPGAGGKAEAGAREEERPDRPRSPAARGEPHERPSEPPHEPPRPADRRPAVVGVP